MTYDSFERHYRFLRAVAFGRKIDDWVFAEFRSSDSNLDQAAEALQISPAEIEYIVRPRRRLKTPPGDPQ